MLSLQEKNDVSEWCFVSQGLYAYGFLHALHPSLKVELFIISITSLLKLRIIYVNYETTKENSRGNIIK